MTDVLGVRSRELSSDSNLVNRRDGILVRRPWAKRPCLLRVHYTAPVIQQDVASFGRKTALALNKGGRRLRQDQD